MKVTVSMEGILGMLHTLSAADKRWLADRLYEDADREQEGRLAPYTMEELNARIDEFEAELEAGGQGYSVEEADKRVREKFHWLSGEQEEHRF